MHIPVLKEEIVEHLNPESNDNFIDCTAGEGGHTFEIIKRIAPNGLILAIDKDQRNIEFVKERAKKIGVERRVIPIESDYIDIEKIVKTEEFKDIAGIIFDLGISSWHIDNSGRGFSFQKDEPLDMRYKKMQNNHLTAEKIVNKYHRSEIERILREYGEERFSKRIAEQIIKVRKSKPIKTTFQLKEIIKKATPFWYHRRKIDPATKTFQALRMIVNRELENIGKVLPLALELLKKGGRISVISFHSLEDRIVKNFFKNATLQGDVQMLTKKPVVPNKNEIIDNPRSRSAKLRTVVKIR